MFTVDGELYYAINTASVTCRADIGLFDALNN